MTYKSSNNNVIFKKFKNKIYFEYNIHLQLCYKQYKIRFYLLGYYFVTDQFQLLWTSIIMVTLGG